MSDDSAGPIRVLMLGLSPLVERMLQAAFEEDGVDVVNSDSLGDLIDAIGDTHADFVVVPLDQEKLPREAREFLARKAHVRVLGVEESDGYTRLYQLVPETTELGDVAPVELLAAVREAAAAAPAVDL